MHYGDIPAEKLYLVRSMSFEEFKNLRATNDGVVFSAKTNSEKGAGGQRGAQVLVALGLDGPAQNSRNTVHFCLNALVGDHVNGTFARQVVGIAPLIANLEPSGPSSFSEIDVAFPYQSGNRVFHGMTFLVDEAFADAAAENAHETGRSPSFQTFPTGQADAAVAARLQALDAPVRHAGWYSWDESPNTDERHAQVKEFEAALAARCGHAIPAQIHSGVLESSCEKALVKIVESASDLFQGRNLYFDKDADLEHLHRLKLLTTQLRMCNVQHPDTRAYIQHLLPVLDAVVVRAEEFDACLHRYHQGDASQVDRMFELAPVFFHEGLLTELASFRTNSPHFPPPLPEFEAPSA